MACSLSTCLAATAQTTIRANDKHLHYEGRIKFNGDTAELIWPGTSITVNFIGSGIDARLRDQDTSNYYNVIVDHNKVTKMHPGREEATYTLAAGLPYGKHTVQLFKRTEWDKGKTWFYGFTSNDRIKFLPPDPASKRKIEFYGNSISCGYAVEDYKGDSPTGYYENNYDAYPAITARHFHAQYRCIAKSGIGIMVSWFPLIMPEMYDRLDPTDSNSKWNFSQYTPDLVVINLLQNDSWIVHQPQNEQFKARFGTTAPDEGHIVDAYRNFVQQIRKKYPHAQIICMLGNMDITRKGSPWPGYVEKAVSLLHDNRIHTYFAPYKETPGHPKTQEQKELAEGLTRFIEKEVKW